MNTLLLRLAVVAALVSAVPAFAQNPVAPATQPVAPASDIIVKRNGDDIAARVEEVTPDVIKYRRLDNLQGPLFTLLRSEVFMIRYANGTKDVFNNPNRPASAPTAYPPVPAPVVTDRSPSSPVYAALPPPPTAEDTVFRHVGASGPRIGATYLGPGKLRKKLRDDLQVSEVISQFGWQFEQRLFSLPHGPTGLFEFVPLVGGLEQGAFLPSVSGILGIRGQNGLEVGIGPNLSLAGAGLVLAAGHTVQSKYINVPINFAVVPSGQGARFSFLIGFTYKTQTH